MKYFFLIAILSFSFLKTSAQEQKVPVGTQPAEIIRMGNDLHVFCSGWDMNGNGIVEKDSGDVEASWWIFDAATMNLKRSRVLEGGFLKEAPLNIAINQNMLYVFYNNKIRQFNSTSHAQYGQVQLDSINVPDSLKKITALSLHPFDTGGSGIVVFSRGNSKYYESILQRQNSGGNNWDWRSTISIYNHPIQILASKSDQYPEINIWDFPIILDKGTSGFRNSSINRPFAGDGEYSTTLGEGANFMKSARDSIIVIMYADHTIHIVDKFTGSIVKTIPTQTTGFKGPRECAIDGDNLYVTTYNCDIRKFSISTGELLKIIPVSGMADPIQIVNGKLIVGITRTCDSLPNNSISVIDITTSVDEEEPFAITASVSPNPFKNFASISASFPPQIHSATIEIFTSSGNSIGVFKKEVMNGELHFPLESEILQLAQGQYMARISAGKQMSVVPFVVVR